MVYKFITVKNDYDKKNIKIYTDDDGIEFLREFFKEVYGKAFHFLIDTKFNLIKKNGETSLKYKEINFNIKYIGSNPK